ncbi:4Fe-4S binding protein [Noviherbaspirillum massiliense]|uniref:4Fe-4S binding protein n=1 Tax=Noviherbaspirillum massiliense TaxID=1465823 RepID=UPI00031DAD56|nr:4Fe-4S binding protein [Noviherbaspirillum massiliense]
MPTQFKLCNCNHSAPIDAADAEKLGTVLGTGPLPVATQLCRRELGSYEDAIGAAQATVVCCTQESSVFSALAQQREAVAPVRFVNIREAAGWTVEGKESLPKMAALLAEAALPEADPVPTVTYVSHGKLLIVGAAEQALRWANSLREHLEVSVLLTGSSAADASLMLEDRLFPVFSGSGVQISGWLGAFHVEWQQDNPIDLERCVRCNACVEACPEHAINLLYQVDRDTCREHGDCVKACGAIGAIDFARSETGRSAEFDLILDLSPEPLIALHQPPQGYFATGNAGGDPVDIALRLTQMVGDFEKPKFFAYKEKLCAHGRNRKTGCNACIEVCSAQAIESNGDHIAVNPNLCVGCGACTTVCPSGALRYAYATAPYTGRRLKTLLTTYAEAGGEQGALLFHAQGQGAALIRQLGRLAKATQAVRGLPARVMPVEVQHIASVGIDLWLTAIAYGASGIAVLATGEEAPQYIAALQKQMAVAQAILSGWGYAGTHLRLIEASSPAELDAALRAMPLGLAPQQRATFLPSADKRNTLDFALEHLYRHAPQQRDELPLPPGAPYGAVQVNTDACTLCMACTGACPASALIDTPDLPRLRFIEKNCVQCGLCVQTCPEQAITLMPRLAMTEAAKKPVTLNETEPFVCIRCHKPFGTLKMVENMLARLMEHGAFAGNLDRLKMCGDCRVIDMMEKKSVPAVTALRRPR